MLDPGQYLLIDTVPMTYTLVIAAEAVVATVLFALLGAAFHRRRSVPYLLLWIASSTLIIKSAVGVVPMVTAFDPTTHLIVDHGLDVVMVLVALGAIHYAGHNAHPTSRQ